MNELMTLEMFIGKRMFDLSCYIESRKLYINGKWEEGWCLAFDKNNKGYQKKLSKKEMKIFNDAKREFNYLKELNELFENEKNKQYLNIKIDELKHNL